MLSYNQQQHHHWELLALSQQKTAVNFRVHTQKWTHKKPIYEKMVNKKPENVTPMMIHTKETAYNKLENFKLVQQVTKQLHLKIQHRMQKVMLQRTAKNKFFHWSNEQNDATDSLRNETHRELNNYIFDFMHLNNVKQNTNTTATTNEKLQNQTML